MSQLILVFQCEYHIGTIIAGTFLPDFMRILQSNWMEVVSVFLDYGLDCGGGVSRKVCFDCVCGGMLGFTENVMFWHGAGLHEVQSVQQDNTKVGMYDRADVIIQNVFNV